MAWHLTSPPSPAEIAALSDEVVHQRIIGTPIKDGRSVCDQTGVQCSTSTGGEGVTCPLCLEVVATWHAKAKAEEARREKSARGKRASAARRRAERKREQGVVDHGIELSREDSEAIDLLIEAGRFGPGVTSRRGALRLAVERLLEPLRLEAERIRASRHVALQTAQVALQLAGKVDGAPKPSRHTTALKARLQRLQNALLVDDAVE